MDGFGLKLKAGSTTHVHMFGAHQLLLLRSTW
jgi:hypothetical protein